MDPKKKFQNDGEESVPSISETSSDPSGDEAKTEPAKQGLVFDGERQDREAFVETSNMKNSLCRNKADEASQSGGEIGASPDTLSKSEKEHTDDKDAANKDLPSVVKPWYDKLGGLNLEDGTSVPRIVITPPDEGDDVSSDCDPVPKHSNGGGALSKDGAPALGDEGLEVLGSLSLVDVADFGKVISGHAEDCNAGGGSVGGQATNNRGLEALPCGKVDADVACANGATISEGEVGEEKVLQMLSQLKPTISPPTPASPLRDLRSSHFFEEWMLKNPTISENGADCPKEEPPEDSVKILPVKVEEPLPEASPTEKRLQSNIASVYDKMLAQSGTGGARIGEVEISPEIKKMIVQDLLTQAQEQVESQSGGDLAATPQPGSGNKLRITLKPNRRSLTKRSDLITTLIFSSPRGTVTRKSQGSIEVLKSTGASGNGPKRPKTSHKRPPRRVHRNSTPTSKSAAEDNSDSESDLSSRSLKAHTKNHPPVRLACPGLASGGLSNLKPRDDFGTRTNLSWTLGAKHKETHLPFESLWSDTSDCPFSPSLKKLLSDMNSCSIDDFLGILGPVYGPFQEGVDHTEKWKNVNEGAIMFMFLNRVILDVSLLRRVFHYLVDPKTIIAELEEDGVQLESFNRVLRHIMRTQKYFDVIVSLLLVDAMAEQHWSEKLKRCFDPAELGVIVEDMDLAYDLADREKKALASSAMVSNGKLAFAAPIVALFCKIKSLSTTKEDVDDGDRAAVSNLIFTLTSFVPLLAFVSRPFNFGVLPEEIFKAIFDEQCRILSEQLELLDKNPDVDQCVALKALHAAHVAWGTFTCISRVDFDMVLTHATKLFPEVEHLRNCYSTAHQHSFANIFSEWIWCKTALLMYRLNMLYDAGALAVACLQTFVKEIQQNQQSTEAFVGGDESSDDDHEVYFEKTCDDTKKVLIPPTIEVLFDVVYRVFEHLGCKMDYGYTISNLFMIFAHAGYFQNGSAFWSRADMKDVLVKRMQFGTQLELNFSNKTLISTWRKNIKSGLAEQAIPVRIIVDQSIEVNQVDSETKEFKVQSLAEAVAIARSGDLVFLADGEHAMPNIITKAVQVIGCHPSRVRIQGQVSVALDVPGKVCFHCINFKLSRKGHIGDGSNAESNPRRPQKGPEESVLILGGSVLFLNCSFDCTSRRPIVVSKLNHVNPGVEMMSCFLRATPEVGALVHLEAANSTLKMEDCRVMDVFSLFSVYAQTSLRTLTCSLVTSEFINVQEVLKINVHQDSDVNVVLQACLFDLVAHDNSVPSVGIGMTAGVLSADSCFFYRSKVGDCPYTAMISAHSLRSCHVQGCTFLTNPAERRWFQDTVGIVVTEVQRVTIKKNCIGGLRVGVRVANLAHDSRSDVRIRRNDIQRCALAISVSPDHYGGSTSRQFQIANMSDHSYFTNEASLARVPLSMLLPVKSTPQARVVDKNQPQRWACRGRHTWELTWLNVLMKEKVECDVKLGREDASFLSRSNSLESISNLVEANTTQVRLATSLGVRIERNGFCRCYVGVAREDGYSAISVTDNSFCDVPKPVVLQKFNLYDQNVYIMDNKYTPPRNLINCTFSGSTPHLSKTIPSEEQERNEISPEIITMLKKKAYQKLFTRALNNYENLPHKIFFDSKDFLLLMDGHDQLAFAESFQ